MKTGIALSVACGALLAGCGQKEEATPASTDENYSSGNPVTAPVDYLGAVNKAQKSAVKNLDLASLKSAIALFHAQEDRYPKDLNELAQQRYIREVPAPPTGSSLNYDPKTGEIRIVKTP